MTKCSICKQEVENTFLGKIKGSYVNKKIVCNSCQAKYKTKEELVKAL